MIIFNFFFTFSIKLPIHRSIVRDNLRKRQSMKLGVFFQSFSFSFSFSLVPTYLDNNSASGSNERSDPRSSDSLNRIVSVC